MSNALDMMITINVINRIDSIVNRLNERRKFNRNYHPKMIIQLGDMLINAHNHRMHIYV